MMKFRLFCHWLLVLNLVFPSQSAKSLNWIDISDLESIYREIGLTDQQQLGTFFNPGSRSQCKVQVANLDGQLNDTLRVICPTIRKCQISPAPGPQRDGSEPLASSDSVADLWKSCVYTSGEKLFKNDVDLLNQLQSTVTQLAFNGVKVATIPDHYFCDLRNLTSLDFSNNRLTDPSKLGLATGCGVADVVCCGCRLKELVLNNNKFENVSDDSFCALPTLVVLRMSRCNIRRLGDNTFRGLDQLKYLDLSKNNLTTLPQQLFNSNGEMTILYLSDNQLDDASFNALKSLRFVRQLYLDRNRIRTVSHDVISALTDLRLLNLRDNLLTALQPDQFRQLTNVRELDLSFNKLAQIGRMSFMGLGAVVTLDLSDNLLQTIETGAFRSCVNLTTLTMSNNQFRKVPVELNSLSNLKHLYLDRNELEELLVSDFVNLTNLNNLDLSDNRLTHLDSGTFDHLRLMITLKLSGNNLTDVSGCFKFAKIINLFLDRNRLVSFSFDDISMDIKFLSMANNNIATFDARNLPSTAMLYSKWTLEELDLGCNNLTTLADLFVPPLLRTLNARNNQLQFISYDWRFMNLSQNSDAKLTDVHLQNNAFLDICKKSLTISRTSKKIKHYFRGNQLRCSCENAWIREAFGSSDTPALATGITDVADLRCRPTLQRANQPVGPSRLTDMSVDNFLCKSDFRINDGKCVCDDSKNCSIGCPVGCQCYSTANLVTVHIDCGLLQTKMVPRYVDSLNVSRDIILYLDGNNFDRLNPTDFASFGKVVKLYLNFSDIVVINAGTFNSIINLQELHLEDNEIETLPPAIFDKLTQLKFLFLQNNLIESLAIDVFTPLRSIRTINFSNNSLTHYDFWSLNKLKSLKNVDFRDNRWTCNCTYLDDVTDFLKNTSIGQTIDRDQIYCTESNGTIADKPIKEYCDAQRIPAPIVNNEVPTITYIWGSLLGIFICVTLISLVIFYFRHEMQVLFYSHYGIRIFQRSESRSAEEDGKIYDAFIAYSSDDEEFLVYNLLPRLEQIDKPYRLCLHQRDFAAGAFITDSILEAVERSSRTIILLSENFIKSEWCRFEFKTAHVQMLHDRCTRVIVVVMGDIPDGLDPEMKLYLKTNTYLKWGEKLFWEKLYYALPEKNAEPKETIEMLPGNK